MEKDILDVPSIFDIQEALLLQLKRPQNSESYMHKFMGFSYLVEPTEMIPGGLIKGSLELPHGIS